MKGKMDVKHKNNFSLSSLGERSKPRGSINNECRINMNSDAYSNHLTGFRIKFGMTGIEYGRSMVEMLGTLAIIGVLSLGALAVYSWAMDKYRSNILTREILERALDVKKQLDLRRRDITLAKWDDISLIGYWIGLEEGSPETVDGKTTVGIQVDDVKKRVCQMTFDNIIGLMPVKVNEHTYTETISDVCNERSIMVFYVDDEWQYKRKIPQISEPSECDINTMPKYADPETCLCKAPLYLDTEKNECVCPENQTMYEVGEGEYTCCPDGMIYADGMCKTTCPEGEIAYCAAETKLISDNISGLQYNTLGIYSYEVYHTTCTEWKCTKAPTILRDPTRNVSGDIAPEWSEMAINSYKDNGYLSPSASTVPADWVAGRDLEVPVPLKDVYSYCALEYNGKCALVTYCNDMPVSWSNYRYRQRCPSCDINMNLNKYICVGNEQKEFSELIDGFNALKHYKENRIKEGECVPERVCNGQYYGSSSSPSCSTSGQCWGPCSTCGGWKTYTDNCGNTYPVADICCGVSSEQGLGCSGVPQGGCVLNYPIKNRTSCCSVACSDAGEEYCCSSPNDGQACCEYKGGEWDSEGSCCKVDGKPCSMYGQCAQYCIDRARR